MLNITPPVLSSLEKFSKNFEGVLGKHQLENFQVCLTGLYLELKRKKSSSYNRLEGSYNSLHHFLSQSPWDKGHGSFFCGKLPKGKIIFQHFFLETFFIPSWIDLPIFHLPLSLNFQFLL